MRPEVVQWLVKLLREMFYLDNEDEAQDSEAVLLIQEHVTEDEWTMALEVLMA